MTELNTEDSTPLTETFVRILRKQTPDDASFQIPPPCFEDMKGEVLDVDAADGRLVVRFPNQERFQNPVGYMQGGMIASALDNVLGPLSYLMGWTALTSQMQISFLHPVASSVDYVVVEAYVTEETGPHLFLRGRVLDDAGTVCAVGHGQFRSTPRAHSQGETRS